MDTEQAIQTLQIESDNLTVEIDKKVVLKQAIDLAISQLQGTLQTQLTELETLKAEKSAPSDALATL